jgi:predicted small secreted protein
LRESEIPDEYWFGAILTRKGISMFNRIFKFTVLFATLAASLLLGACQNTIHGAGRDMENAGEAVQDSVE